MSSESDDCEARAVKLKERVEALTARPKKASSPEELRDTFSEVASIMDECYELEDDAGKKRLAGVREVVRGLAEVVSDDPETKQTGRNRISNSEAFQVHVLKTLLAKVSFDESAVAGARAKFDAMPDNEKQQMLYIQNLAFTADAFGIILRGHVLIENALQLCIYNYVPNPVNLYTKLEMFFAQKVRLAHMLGIITDDERNLLNEFNTLRNALAHQGADPTKTASPDFQLTAKREEQLWKSFVANPATKGDWPEYDASKFPIHLRYIVLALYMRLYERAEDLKAKKLTPVVNSLELVDSIHTKLRPHMTAVLVDLMGKMGETPTSESKPEPQIDGTP